MFYWPFWHSYPCHWKSKRNFTRFNRFFLSNKSEQDYFSFFPPLSFRVCLATQINLPLNIDKAFCLFIPSRQNVKSQTESEVWSWCHYLPPVSVVSAGPERRRSSWLTCLRGGGVCGGGCPSLVILDVGVAPVSYWWGNYCLSTNWLFFPTVKGDDRKEKIIGWVSFHFSST